MRKYNKKVENFKGQVVYVTSLNLSDNKDLCDEFEGDLTYKELQQLFGRLTMKSYNVVEHNNVLYVKDIKNDNNIVYESLEDFEDEKRNLIAMLKTHRDVLSGQDFLIKLLELNLPSGVVSFKSDGRKTFVKFITFYIYDEVFSTFYYKKDYKDFEKNFDSFNVWCNTNFVNRDIVKNLRKVV